MQMWRTLKSADVKDFPQGRRGGLSTMQMHRTFHSVDVKDFPQCSENKGDRTSQLTQQTMPLESASIEKSQSDK